MKEGARREEVCANGCWGRFVIAVGLFVCLLFGEDSRTRRKELNFNKN